MHGTDRNTGLAPAHRLGLAVLALLAIALGVYGWYKFFREEPQDVGDGYARDALPLRLDRRRTRRRNSVLDLLRAAAHVPRKAARAGRLRVARRVLGAGPGTADRLHQEDRRISARREQLRGLPHHELSHQARREPGVRQRRAGPHAQSRSLLPFSRRLREGSALQRGQPDARNQPRHRPAVDRAADVSLPASFR